MDKFNWIILEELQKNARIPLTQLAKKVGMSSPSVAERIQKMEDAEIIKNYSANVNMSALGYLMGVYISIKIRFGQVENFEKYVVTVPEICSCQKLTGDDCMLMKAHVRNPAHLEELNVRLAVFGDLTTSLILKTIIKDKIYSKEF